MNSSGLFVVISQLIFVREDDTGMSQVPEMTEGKILCRLSSFCRRTSLGDARCKFGTPSGL